MKLVILAAGYATRLYPLTLDRPKPLLEVGGRPILEHLLERLAAIEEIDGTYVVTNSKFAEHFRRWSSDYDAPRPEFVPRTIDDGTTDDATKLGAIGDLELLLREHGVEDDLIVAAGDNLFSDDLGGFGDYAADRGAPVVAVYDVGDPEQMSKYNSIQIDADGRITYFEEKPDRASSTLTGIALYFYPRSTLPLIRRYVEEGNNADQPGRLVEWMYSRTPFYTWQVPGRWFDIGSHETLEAADREFSKTSQT